MSINKDGDGDEDDLKHKADEVQSINRGSHKVFQL